MSKKKKQITEKEKLENGLSILNAIINETFTRHNDLTEQEYKERLNAKDSKLNEEQIVRVGLYNIFIELTKEVFRMQQKVNLTAGTIQLTIKEKKNGK